MRVAAPLFVHCPRGAARRACLPEAKKRRAFWGGCPRVTPGSTPSSPPLSRSPC
ncbi:unnamed protein product, partial [Ectocarpus sp. 13 AM-2016]